MKYIYWIVVSIVVILGIGFSVFLSSEIETVSKIPYAHYSDPAKLAETLQKELSSDLKTASLVMLGVMPGREMDLHIWKSFLEQTSAPELQYPAVVIDPELPGAKELFPHAVQMNLKTDLSRFIEGAKNARTRGIRMAVILPSLYSSQMLSENPVNKMKQASDLKPLSLSLIPFPRSAAEETNMEYPCVMGSNDRNGSGPLGCYAVKKARLLYGQKAKPEFYEGLVDTVKEQDYLILFNSK